MRRVFSAVLTVLAIGLFAPLATAQTPTPTPDLVGILRQHYLAVNRGDVAAAYAFFTPDAAIARGGRCLPELPCTGDAVRTQIETEIRNRASFGIISAQATGNVVTARVEFWSLAVANAQVPRIHVIETVTFSGNRISRYIRELDLSDATTQGFTNFQRVAGVMDTRIIEALGRRDLNAVVAGFAEDAVIDGFMGPYRGADMIRHLVEFWVEDNFVVQLNPGHTRVNGNTWTAPRPLTSNGIRSLGLERIWANLTADVVGNRILSLRFDLDVSDAETATFIAASTPRQQLVPARMPAAGTAGLRLD